MTNEEKKQYIKRNLWPTLVGFAGFLVLFAAVCTEEARDTLPAKEAKELMSQKNTLLMGLGGATTILGALTWGKIRNRKDKERE